jgi:hypothetical protein
MVTRQQLYQCARAPLLQMEPKFLGIYCVISGKLNGKKKVKRIHSTYLDENAILFPASPRKTCHLHPELSAKDSKSIGMFQ